MAIAVIQNPVQLEDLRALAHPEYPFMIKAVVDIEQGIMAVGGELHADEEVKLSEEYGSKRENSWGINLYFEKQGEDFLEYDSMVNLKPDRGNKSRGVENEETRKKIADIVDKLIIR